MSIKSVVAILMVLLCVGSSSSQTLLYKGLCVGITDYPGTADDRVRAALDAAAVRSSLVNYLGWHASYVAILTDGNATEDAIYSGISNLPRSDGNTSLLFLNGHGDSDIGFKTVDGSWISPSSLQYSMGTSSDQYVVFVDAPYSGLYTEYFSHGVVTSSCAMDEDAPPLNGYNYYSYYLVYYMDSYETAEEIHDNAADFVVYATNQTPQIADNYSGNLSLKDDNLYVPDEYASLSSALSSASSGERVVVSGSAGLTGNVSVPSGVVLWIKTGSSLTLNGYSIGSSGGTIVIQSGSTISGLGSKLKTTSAVIGLYPSIQSGINAASSGSSQIVEVPSGSFTENPSISSKNYVTLTGSGQASTTINGAISITSSSYATVSNLALSGSITFNNCSHAFASSVTTTGTILFNGYGGSTNTLGSLTANSIGASFGVNAYGGSGDLYSSTIQNGDLAVYLTSNASYNIGTGNYFCGNGLDIYTSGGYAYAISNVYSCPLPGSISGNVYTTGQNGSCSEECGGFRVVSNGLDVPTKTNQESPVSQSKLETLNSEYMTLLRRIRSEQSPSAFDLSKYRTAIDELHTGYAAFVNDTVDAQLFKASLQRLQELSQLRGEPESFYEYIAARLASGLQRRYIPFVKRHLVWYHVSLGDFKSAVDLASEVRFDAFADESLVAEMLYEKGLVYKYYLNDPAMAKRMTSSILETSPSNLLAQFAQTEFGLETPPAEGTQSSQSVQDGALLGFRAFPNPFNPETRLEYTLGVGGIVELQIYDMLGRMVSSIEEGFKSVGSYSLTWDGSRLSSGVYVAKIIFTPAEGGQTILTQKLVLTR